MKKVLGNSEEILRELGYDDLNVNILLNRIYQVLDWSRKESEKCRKRQER